jgi:hypothetical protein
LEEQLSNLAREAGSILRAADQHEDVTRSAGCAAVQNASAKVPFMTKSSRNNCCELGHDDAISKMLPEQAHKALARVT